MNLKCFLIVETLAIASTLALPVSIPDEERKVASSFIFIQLNGTGQEGLTACNHPSSSLAKFSEKLIHIFFYKKTISLPEPRFSQHNARN